MNKNEIAHELICIANDVKGLTPAQVKEGYAIGENNRDSFLAKFDQAVTELAAFAQQSETAAKAAAYDKIKNRLNGFVQQLTAGKNCVPSEAVLNDTIEKLIGSFTSSATAQQQTAAVLMQPIAYARKLEQQLVAKDNEIAAKAAEIEQLKQQLTAKEAEVADLTSKLSAGVGASK